MRPSILPSPPPIRKNPLPMRLWVRACTIQTNVLYFSLNMVDTNSQSVHKTRKRRPAASDPTREKLLDVAGRIFADRGYRAATIREICLAAGANVAAVNYHFGDKMGTLHRSCTTIRPRRPDRRHPHCPRSSRAAGRNPPRRHPRPPPQHLQRRSSGLALSHPHARTGPAHPRPAAPRQ